MIPLAPDSADFCRRHLAAIAANGFHAFPIPPSSKRTHWSGWTRWCRSAPRPDQIARWADEQGHYGLALACGHACLAIDIDDEDVGRAGDLHALASSLLGATPLVRFGRAPRRVLIYRVAGRHVASRRLAPNVELIGDGRYVLAHGIHPDLGRPYVWPERGPESLPLAEVPAPDVEAIAAFAEAVTGFYNLPTSGSVVTPQPLVTALQAPSASRPVPTRASFARPDPSWVLDASGRVCDGREAYLAAQVYRAYREAEANVDAVAIADTAWARFCATADLTRARRDGGRPWRRPDALAKARALLRRSPGSLGGSARRGPDSFWTGPVLAAFTHVVNARAAAGDLPPAAVAVSHAMTSLAHASGVCFASPATLAGGLGLAVRTVKQARAILVAAGLWQVENNTGGRARGADYRPDPDALSAGEMAETPSPARRTAKNRNGARTAHPNLPVVDGSTPQDEPRDGTPSPKRIPARHLGSVCSRVASPKCLSTRRSGVAIGVGDVPKASAEPPAPPNRGRP